KVGVAGHSMVALLPALPIVGGVVSTLVLRWLTVPLVLPQPSTALQLRVVTKVHEFPEVVSPRFVAVTDGEAGHCTVLSAPGAPMVGFVVSPVPRVRGPVSLVQLWASLTKIVCV